jgi:hypothetical protein
MIRATPKLSMSQTPKMGMVASFPTPQDSLEQAQNRIGFGTSDDSICVPDRGLLPELP